MASLSAQVLPDAAFMREFGEEVPRPTVYQAGPAGGCPAVLTATAYLRRSPTSAVLLALTTASNKTLRRSQTTVDVPAGMFRVLSLLVAHRATFATHDLEFWDTAQAQINQDHRDFAQKHNLREPIVNFQNTNLTVDAMDPTFDPRKASSVRQVAETKGIDPAGFNYIVSVNLDPTKTEGGFAGADGFIYMGNFGPWLRRLTPAEWASVARAVYHHEVAHHWGWTHDWAASCNSDETIRPFVVPPVLLGWEDVDGDGVPEILDSTPYGRRR